MEDLIQFMELNGISDDILFEAVHKDILETVLKLVCDKMKHEKSFLVQAKKVFFSTDDLDATRKVIALACDCKLTQNDYLWMKKCITAFLTKNSVRKPFDKEIKMRLLDKQMGLCAICSCQISLQDMHVDHIIPWDYVGDKLDDNYQGLCGKCNLSKSNNVAKAVTNIITHGRVKA